MPSSKKNEQSFLPGVRTGRVMDIEAVLNETLVRDCFYPTIEDPERATKMAKLDFERETKSDFLPLVFHVPVCIAVGRYQIASSGEMSWLNEPICIRPKDENGNPIPQDAPNYIDELVKLFWGACEKWEGMLVTFNGRGFDFPVLEMQAIRLGLKCPNYFQDAKTSFRHRYGRHIDIMDVLSNYGAARRVGRLDYILKMLGLPGKGEVHGSEVNQLWKDKRFNEVEEYCVDDVKQTFECFKRLEVTRGQSGTASGTLSWR